ncbi:MAG: CaiB/BaiF CoA transferase family protein [Vicinamibacterales bacterium]
MSGPLTGVRVLEFSQIVAAPFCGCILSDAGADVVKVEPPRGDSHRNSGAVIPGMGKRFQSLNRGKRSLTIDLQTDEGRELVYRLIPDYDVMIINYRVGVPKRLGIDYETLAKINPRLIYAEITGFGTRGPLKDRAGTDIVGVAYSGLMVGEAKIDEDGRPMPISSASIADYCAGFSAASAITGALYHREKSGVGQKIETSLLQAALAIQDTVVMRDPISDASGRDKIVSAIRQVRERRGSYREILAARAANRGRNAAFGTWYGGHQTSDGQVIILGALTPITRNGARKVVGIADDNSDEPGFDASDPENIRRAEERRARVAQVISEKPIDYWVEQFSAAGVPCAPVNVPEEMSEDPQVVATSLMHDIDHPEYGPQKVAGPVTWMSVTPPKIHGPAPYLGGNTVEVLQERGFTQGEIDGLLQRGTVTVPD